MRKRSREENDGMSYGKVLRNGFFGMGTLLLLLIAAFLSDKISLIQNSKVLTGKLCLTIAAMVCGIMSVGKATKAKLLYAASGEWGMLLVILVCSMFFGLNNGLLSLLCDIGLVLFGAFAGALAGGNIRIQRRGKRVYRT